MIGGHALISMFDGRSADTCVSTRDRLSVTFGAVQEQSPSWINRVLMFSFVALSTRNVHFARAVSSDFRNIGYPETSFAESTVPSCLMTSSITALPCTLANHAATG